MEPQFSCNFPRFSRIFSYWDLALPDCPPPPLCKVQRWFDPPFGGLQGVTTPLAQRYSAHPPQQCEAHHSWGMPGGPAPLVLCCRAYLGVGECPPGWTGGEHCL